MSKKAIEHYEAALKEAFPSGATGDVFHHWNEARKAVAEKPAQRDDWKDRLIAQHEETILWQAKRIAEFTSPPAQRTWAGLTVDEIEECYSDTGYIFARAIEAKLKQKNT